MGHEIHVKICHYVQEIVGYPPGAREPVLLLSKSLVKGPAQLLTIYGNNPADKSQTGAGRRLPVRLCRQRPKTGRLLAQAS
jgi:hypothetical protein